ncbi:MAG: hypothetical protein HYZ81_17125, partial [Nitrospinae bacterium]|nr:hypothetical protein [Nitrospinota bacterium]
MQLRNQRPDREQQVSGRSGNRYAVLTQLVSMMEGVAEVVRRMGVWTFSQRPWGVVSLLGLLALLKAGGALVEAAPFAYISHSSRSGGGFVAVIDTLRNAVVATVPVSQTVHVSGVAVHPAGTFVYVMGGNTVFFIKTITNTVVDSVGVGNEPFGI